MIQEVSRTFGACGRFAAKAMRRLLLGLREMDTKVGMGAAGRGRHKRERGKVRAHELLSNAVQPLEPRLLMTTLYWAPNWTSGTHTMGGSGTWGQSNAVWNTAVDGSGSQVAWGNLYGNGTIAVFGVTGGTVLVSGDLYNSNPSLQIQVTANGYDLEQSGSGGIGNVTIDVASGKSAVVNSLLGWDVIKTGSGELSLGQDNSYSLLDVQAGQVTVLSGADITLYEGDVGVGAGMEVDGTLTVADGWLYNNGQIDIDEGSLTVEEDGGLYSTGGISLYDASLTVESGGQLINDYQLHIEGDLTIAYGGTLENNYDMYLYDESTLTNSGTLNIRQYGTLTVPNDAVMTNAAGGNMTIYSGGTLEILWGGTMDNLSSIEVSGGTINVLGGGYGDKDAEFYNGSWISFFEGAHLTVAGNQDDGEGEGLFLNDGETSFSDGAVAEIGEAGRLHSNVERVVSLLGDGDDTSLTVAAGGALENEGWFYAYEGTTLTLEGYMSNGTDGEFYQTGGEVTVEEEGEFDNAGAYICSDGEFTNNGLVVLRSPDLGIIDAINDYGVNNGTVAFDDDEIDLSNITLNGGKYINLGTITNDGDFAIGSETIVMNYGKWIQNDSYLTEYRKIKNYNELSFEDLLVKHWSNNTSFEENFFQVFSATGEGYGTAEIDPFDLKMKINGGSQVIGAWDEADAENAFLLEYDATNHTVTFTTGGQSAIAYDVIWGESEGYQDALFIMTETDGESGGGVTLKNMSITQGGITSNIVDDSSYWQDSTGSHALQITKSGLGGSSFTISGEAVALYASMLKMSIKGGLVPIAAAPAEGDRRVRSVHWSLMPVASRVPDERENVNQILGGIEQIDKFVGDATDAGVDAPLSGSNGAAEGGKKLGDYISTNCFNAAMERDGVRIWIKVEYDVFTDGKWVHAKGDYQWYKSRLGATVPEEKPPMDLENGGWKKTAVNSIAKGIGDSIKLAVKYVVTDKNTEPNYNPEDSNN